MTDTINIKHLPDKFYLIVDEEELEYVKNYNYYKIVHKHNLYYKQYIVEYITKDFSEYDLDVIFRHSKSTVNTNETGEVVVFSFTHYHPLELLRERKIKLCEKIGVEPDDTIFATVTKKVVVPEKVIPSYEKEVKVVWECWDDIMTIDYDCCSECGCDYKC